MLSRYTLSILIALFFGLFAASCHKDEPVPPVVKPEEIDTSILLYAVASNNLSSSFYEDLQEMEIGLEKADLSKVDYYVYSVTQGMDPGPVLQKAVRDANTGSVSFKEVKRYDRAVSSAGPDRIREVISDYSSFSAGKTKGLILWSHSTAWAPAPGTVAMRPAQEEAAAGELLKNHPSTTTLEVENLGRLTPDDIRWWGQDINNGTATYCNLPDLASAIPDGYFDFIWFDCCYMSSIEVIYEMRHKADMFVAYPTEVLAEGAPYHIVIPLIASPDPNLTAAADAMSEYYLSGNKIFTMAVIDPSPIEEIADMAQAAIPGTRPRAYTLQKYSRNGYYFYDFGQYTSTWGESLGEEWDRDRFLSLMDQLIIYKNCGSRLFTGQAIDKDNYSGISCAYFDYAPTRASSDYDDEEDQKYYLELEWFKRVYEPFWPSFLQ